MNEEYSKSITMTTNNISYGIRTLEYYSIDRIGNKSRTNNVNFIRSLLSLNKDASTWVGVNFTDRILGARQSGRLPYPNQPTSVYDRLADVQSIGMNMIRIRMYWEGYRYFVKQGKEADYINKVKEFADNATKLGMGIVYDVLHQYHISSGIFNDGVGFPWETVSYLGSRQSWNTTIAQQFWDDFLNNSIIDTYTGKNIWQSYWDDYLSKIVEVTKDKASTLGWCIINEPVFAGRDTLPSDAYDKLGAFHTFITQKIASATPSSTIRIIVQRIYDGRQQWEFNAQYDLLTRTIPSSQQVDSNTRSRLVFEAHFYRPGTIPSATKTRWTNIMNHLGLPVFIGEWNTDRDTELTLAYAVDYYRTFKQWNAGSAFFQYDPGYPWSIKDDQYNDRMLASGIKVKDILVEAIKQAYII